MMRKSITKGIILAGGMGSRLSPLTNEISKQLLPVYDKPMIYYSLSTLMLAGIKDILMIVAPKYRSAYEGLLGNGSQWGMKITYQEQKYPRGLPEAYILAEEFLDHQSSILILGDNIFYGHMLEDVLKKAIYTHEGATLFVYRVKDPSQYGVINYHHGEIIDIVEKPKCPPSNYAVTGMYIFDQRAVSYAKKLTPSERGELEIVDLIKSYSLADDVHDVNLCRGMAWLDAGTPKDLLNASQYIAMLEERQGSKIYCPEEVAWRKNLISFSEFHALVNALKKSEYSNYLKMLVQEQMTNSTLEEGVV